jgi:nitrate/nitrite-specific signal transduction histidine kinase
MHERAQLLRGTLEVHSPRGIGTRIRLRAPWTGLDTAEAGATPNR